MGKGANKQLMNNSGTAQSRSGQLYGQGTTLFNQVDPQLTSEMVNPQGYTPQQLAYMNTASQQSLGGSVGGVTSQANLTAARTRNAGGFQGAIASGSRAGARQLSENALGIQKSQADLQQAQRQQAIQQLMQLYNLSESEAANYLGVSNTALNDENNASGANGLFGQALLAGIKGASQVGAAAAGG